MRLQNLLWYLIKIIIYDIAVCVVNFSIFEVLFVACTLFRDALRENSSVVQDDGEADAIKIKKTFVITNTEAVHKKTVRHSSAEWCGAKIDIVTKLL